MWISPNIPTLGHLSLSKTISPPPIANPLLWVSFSNLSLNPKNKNRSSVIRMGGGPRTYPGGVSKWQWKRMQAKKAKQLLKARLARERHIYQMRKRAELKAAVSELERPWEPVRNAPTLFSVSADEQLKVLADRFQKPGGLDLWSDRDGPQLFRTLDGDGVPSARFFPKGVVHSVKPYGKVSSLLGEEKEEVEGFGVDGEASGDSENIGRKNNRRDTSSRSRNARVVMDSRDSVPDRVNRGRGISRIRNGNCGRGRHALRDSRRSQSDGEVYDMLLGNDGSYGLEA